MQFLFPRFKPGLFGTRTLAMLAGVAPVSANATSTLVLVPGALASTAAYRDHLRQPRGVLPAFLVASLTGGLSCLASTFSRPGRPPPRPGFRRGWVR